MTADHGAQLSPSVTGAFQISPRQLEADLNRRFDDGDDVPATLRVRTSQVYMNLQELRDGGYTLDDVARFIDEYTEGQAAPNPNSVAPADRDVRVMQAAFPTQDLYHLPCLPEARR
jgi:hypothetical protein